MNNAEALSGNSQAVSNFMALWNQEIIPRDNILGTDNSKGNLISREKISGIDNFGKNLSLENEEKVKARLRLKLKRRLKMPELMLKLKQGLKQKQRQKKINLKETSI